MPRKMSMYNKIRSFFMKAFFRDVYDPKTKTWNHFELRRRAKGYVAVLVAFVVFFGGIGYLGVKVYGDYREKRLAVDYDGAGDEDVVVKIPEGANSDLVADILITAEVVKTAKAFNKAFSMYGDSKKLMAARYKLKKHMSAEAAVKALMDAKNITHNKLTLVEGLTLKQAVAEIARVSEIKPEQITKGLADWEKYGLPKWANGKAEGFLFPDTYELDDKDDVIKILKRPVGRFNEIAKEINLEEKAKEIGRTPMEILTIASIVQAEVRKTDDMPKVASVIYNRLKKDMMLQMDSTVHYYAGKDGKVTTTSEQRNDPNPYNTYKHKGLPPGPINAPGKDAILAALNPMDTGWLYFATIDLDSGETTFSNTEEEHKNNEKRLQEWCAAHEGKC